STKCCGSTAATVGHGTRLCAVCSAKTANNVGCIGDATIFSIFQYYMCRDNSILRRRAARSAVARRQLPWVMGPGYVLWERKACKKCRMYTVMPQSFSIKFRVRLNMPAGNLETQLSIVVTEMLI